MKKYVSKKNIAFSQKSVDFQEKLAIIKGEVAKTQQKRKKVN